MSNEETGSDKQPGDEGRTEVIECQCEICKQIIYARTLPLLGHAYNLHMRDHETERARAANRVKLVKKGGGWVLTRTANFI